MISFDMENRLPNQNPSQSCQIHATANPNPCIPGAEFEYIKSDGNVELRKFAATLSDSDVERQATAVAKKLEKIEPQPVEVIETGREMNRPDFGVMIESSVVSQRFPRRSGHTEMCCVTSGVSRINKVQMPS